MTALIAAMVEHCAAPPGGLQLPVMRRESAPFAAKTGPLQYPREAIDNDGARVRLTKPAMRIASQYLSLDDFVYTVAPPDHVVAVSANAYLSAYSNVYQQAERFHPAISSDPETVLRLNPDLILVSSDGRADYTSLVRSSGVPLYRMQTNFQSLADVEKAILLTGYLTGDDETARRKAAEFHANVEKACALRPKGAPVPRILGLAGLTYTYGRDSLFNDVVHHLGGVNVAADAGLKGFAAVSSEQIINWRPEWIISGAEADKTTQVLKALLSDPAVALTPAARDGRVVVLDNRIFLPNSPFVIRLVEALANTFYTSKSSERMQ